MRRTIKLIICYDGTNYAGWQVQSDRCTIQGTIENALKLILKTACSVTGAGRTDAGVHALAQVAHFHTTSAIPVNNLKLALNSILPKDIAITNIQDEVQAFHARKSAVSKKYSYRIYREKTRDPFLWPYTWQLSERLDLEEIRVCLPILQGEHDFSSFSVTDRDMGDAIRHIFEIKMLEEEKLLIFEFHGNSFLRKQIRRIVGTLIGVGRGRFNRESVKEILLAKDPTKAGSTAPAKGLFLMEVLYPENK